MLRSPPSSIDSARVTAPPRPRGPAALTRLLRVHAVLVEGRPATARSLAEVLGVTERTIKRDLALLRDQHGCPLAWDPARRSYYYTRECDLLPLLRLTSQEAISLALASQVFGAWAGTPLGQALNSALSKIAGVVGGTVSIPATSLPGVITEPNAPSSGDAESRHFPALVEAIHRRRELRLQYQKPRASERDTRLVHPLHLALLDHRWVLVAFDVGRGAPRNFLLHRIRAIRSTEAHFEPPADFDINRYLAGSLGRFTGEQTYDVRVRFDATVAGYLRERPWHRSQTVERELPDGAIEVHYRLNNLIDVQRRILACGQHARALAPAELVAAVRSELEQALHHYPPTSKSLLAAAESAETYSQGHPLSP